jgi:hypothetical protein
MPAFDGTGPRGEGPFSGRGEGYCAVRLSPSDQGIRGYAGLQGTPVVRRLRLAARRGRGLGRGRSRRGRWFTR